MNAGQVAEETITDGGGPVRLTATEVVLKRLDVTAGRATIPFTPNWASTPPSTKDEAAAHAEGIAARIDLPVDHDDYLNATHLALDAQVWRDMGEPDTLTVRVLPGYRMADHEAGMGPVTEVQHIAGASDVAMVRHDPAEAGDTRPQHDDVTSDDVREDTTRTAGLVAEINADRDRSGLPRLGEEGRPELRPL